MRKPNSALRTVDVARRAGCSVQQVRNLERDGVLPATTRTGSNHRTYTESHVRAALAYRALASGVGPAQARQVMRAAYRPDLSELLSLLDEAHARLHTERDQLSRAREAVAAISAEPMDQPRPEDAMAISELADALGVPTSTLRHWDAEGLVVPPRLPRGAARTYSPADVRDARITHQLRQAGYRIHLIRELLPELRQGGRGAEVETVLRSRQDSITVRSRALLRGAAAVEALIER